MTPRLATPTSWASSPTATRTPGSECGWCQVLLFGLGGDGLGEGGAGLHVYLALDFAPGPVRFVNHEECPRPCLPLPVHEGREDWNMDPRQYRT
jgi:hypothetical protein